VDHAGNVYICEDNNHRILRVDATGIITTVAGNGTAGFSGDNGAATSTQINNPRQIAVDSSLSIQPVAAIHRCQHGIPGAIGGGSSGDPRLAAARSDCEFPNSFRISCQSTRKRYRRTEP
jgi:hypothetical protein